MFEIAVLLVATAMDPAPPAPQSRLVPLEVSINGARAGQWVLLERGGALYAPLDAFDEWRLKREPGAASVHAHGGEWYPLSALPGYAAAFNAAEQSLALNFLPGAFTATRVLPPMAERPAVSPALTALFANYDLSYTHSHASGAATVRDLGALTELGFSGAPGVLTTSHIGRNLAGDASAPGPSWRRLETTFTRDFPRRDASLRLGDSATRAGSWARPVYFGGVQFGSNYTFVPGFVTQPVPTFAGQSTAPSTVELYVNDALRQTSQVPTGPFTIDNFPQITGAGQARVVVRDLLGRETVLVQDFFSHAALLRPGLSDWSVEAGAVRRNIGIESANYGEGFAAGLWRRGFTDALTGEARAEAGAATRGAGAGLTAALPLQLLGQVALAASRDDATGDGHLWMAGLEHFSLRHGFTLRTEAASRDYRQIGQLPGFAAPRRQALASYTYSTPDFGHLGLAAARVATFEQHTLTTYSANYTLRLAGRASLTLSATRVVGGPGGSTLGANLLVPLADRMSAAGALTRRAGSTDGYASVAKGLGIEAGAGWRALAGRRAGEATAEGGWYYQGGRGLLSADVSASEPQQVARLGAQGGLVLAEGRLFAARKLQESFALVEVPGYADVGVGFQSSVLARTDADGVALVPRLLPYRTNSIRLDPNELPISAELDTIEMVVVPPARSGVKVTFPVRSGRGALVSIVLDDGAAAPSGAEVALAGDDRTFYVARRGEAFVTGLAAASRLRLTWQGRSCELEVVLPPGGAEDIPRVGPYLCAGVPR